MSFYSSITNRYLNFFVCLFLIILFNNNHYSQIGQPDFLTSFTAEKLNKKVKLKWTVDTEINIEKYTIERSVDGIYFDLIISQNSHGNSSNNATYVKFDNSPLEGSAYYKLNSIDYNGDTTFTETIAFNNEYLADELPIFNMFPNPYNGGGLTIEFIALLWEESQVIVNDINGKTIHQSLIVSDIITLDLPLSKGIYLVSILTTSDRLIKKLVVD